MKGKLSNISKDELYDLYITQNMSQTEVAEKFNVSRGRICEQLKVFGIKKDLKSIDLKRKATTLEKYGCDNPAKSDIIKQKIKETNLERYGTEYGFQSDIIKRKIKETTFKHYGVNCCLKSNEIRERINNTNLERYGNKCSLHSDETANKVKITNLERYGVENPVQSDIIKQKIKETNLERYGTTTILATEKNRELLRVQRLNSNDGKNKIFEKIFLFGTDDDIKEYFIENFSNMTIDEICENTGYTHCTIASYLRKHTELYNIINFKPSISKYENEIADYLKSLNLQVFQNVKNIIPPQELDIYIPDKHIAVEFNGDYWHSTEYKDKYYHQNKTKMCEKNGIHLIHIYEHEWLSDNKEIKRLLKSITIDLSKCNVINNLLIYNNEIISSLVDGVFYGILGFEKLANTYISENNITELSIKADANKSLIPGNDYSEPNLISVENFSIYGVGYKTYTLKKNNK